MLTFHRNLLYQPEVFVHTLEWNQLLRNLSIKQHGVMYQKTVIFKLTAVRTSALADKSKEPFHHSIAKFVICDSSSFISGRRVVCDCTFHVSIVKKLWSIFIYQAFSIIIRSQFSHILLHIFFTLYLFKNISWLSGETHFCTYQQT
jgi:hypothetical protein